MLVSLLLCGCVRMQVCKETVHEIDTVGNAALESIEGVCTRDL